MKAADRERRAIILALFRGVIQDTAVDTGRAAGNWQTTAREPARGEINTRGIAAAVAGIEPNISALDEPTYLTNNVPYIAYLEYGTPKMAAHNMVGRNIRRIVAAIRRRNR
jgi:hypothetical protein